MSRKWYRKNGQAYLENGNSKISVGFLGHFKSPNSPGRVGKLLVCQTVLRESGHNPISSGQSIAISFPEEHVNKKRYTWKTGEEFQIEVQVKVPDQFKKAPAHLQPTT